MQGFVGVASQNSAVTLSPESDLLEAEQLEDGTSVVA